MTTPRSESTLAPRLFLSALASALVLALTLAPRRIVAPARGVFLAAADRWLGPLVVDLTTPQLESLLNALLFIPLGAAVALLLGRRLWLLAPVVGFAVSFAVEYAQSRIPGRVPDLQDVVWNTVGAGTGAVVAGLILVAAGRSRLRT
ncbi:VanZ family protein [Microbacterium jejuense]|uniref:VanZ family protein n=1 Tax=Microbacterium jejuense TaxID=1263637 RepID=A0ABS7HPP4_9MICO|nr:VanZ family protein [Microbacterium jejuense]MBW9094685.1 VanZ family protein [Microbacterium jejuense]